MKSAWKIILIVLVVAIFIAGEVYWWQNSGIKNLITGNAEEEITVFSDCSKIGASWISFTDSKTDLSFCYKADWGEPSIEETSLPLESREGTVYYVKFANEGPGVNYSTLDYKKTGDRGTPDLFNWSGFDLRQDESEILKLFPEVDRIKSLSKLTLRNDFFALFVEIDLFQITGDYKSGIFYFIPNVLIGGQRYNLEVSSFANNTDLRSFIGSMNI